MKNILNTLLFFCCLLTSCVIKAQGFNYNSNKNCGKYDFKILVNEVLQNDNTSVEINLDDYSSNIDLSFVVQDVGFGFGRKCEKKKKKDHKDKYFLELSKGNITDMHPKGFKKLEAGIVKIGALGNKTGIKEKVKITYQLDQVAIKSNITDKILLGFNVMNENGVNSAFEVLVKYKIVKSAKIEKESTPTLEADEANSDEVILAADTSNQQTQPLDESGKVVSMVVLQDSTEIEKELWAMIKKDVLEKNWKNVKDNSWKYRNTFKAGPHYEEAWYVSIRCTKDKSEKSFLCRSYFKEFPEGKFYNKIKKEYNKIAKKKSKAKGSAEDKDTVYWNEKVLSLNKRISYKKYLEKFGKKNAFYATEALAKIENFELSEKNRIDTDTSMLINIAYSGNEGEVPFIEVLAGKENLVDSIRSSIFKSSFNLKVDKVVQLSFYVKGSPWKKNTIILDSAKPPFFAEWNLDEKEMIAELINVENGKGPFDLELINIDDDEIVSRYSFAEIRKSVKIDFDTLNYMVAGNYKFRIRDKFRVNSFISDSFFLEKSNNGKWLKFLVGFLIFSIFGALLFYKSKSNKKENLSTENIVLLEPERTTHSREQEPSEVVSTSENGTSNHVNIRKRIKVHGVRSKYNEVRAMSKDDFVKRTSGYLPLSTSELWSDSKILQVFVSTKCLETIDNFVFKKMQQHRLPTGEVPEVGGFLLGNYTEENGKYLVSLQKFIDIESEQSGVYQISFGAKAWSKLEKEMESFESSTYGLMGWFHTHPGHGLFLSPPDLNIHKNFFRKPFQLAMEIDSVVRPQNPKYDVAFFTQKMNGEMNNVNDLEADWFQWEEIKNVYM